MRASSLLSRDATWNDCNSPGVSYTSEPLGNRFSSFTTPRCSGAHAARFIKANLEISFSLFIGARVGSPGAVELRVNTGFNSHASPGAFRCYGCTEVNLYTASTMSPGMSTASLGVVASHIHVIIMRVGKMQHGFSKSAGFLLFYTFLFRVQQRRVQPRKIHCMSEQSYFSPANARRWGNLLCPRVFVM